MKATSRPRTAYHRLVRSFDHSDLAALPSYPAVRQALGDIASQVADTALAAFAAAVRDMGVTAPFADLCGACNDQCARDHPPGPDGGPCQCGDSCYWPHAAAHADDWITGSYRCRQGHTWTCGYPISIRRRPPAGRKDRTCVPLRGRGQLAVRQHTIDELTSASTTTKTVHAATRPHGPQTN